MNTPNLRQFYDPTTGEALIGTEDDGARGRWRLHTRGVGVHSGIIMGPPDSGRSNLLNVLLMALAQSGLFVPWLSDPLGRNGKSFKEWFTPWLDGQQDKPVIDWIATSSSETTKMLKSAAAVVEKRLELGGYEDQDPDHPGIMILIDECEYAFRTGVAARAAEVVVTRGAEAGVGIIVTCADADLRTTFGGRRALRQGFAASPNRIGMGADARAALADLNTGQ